jgi:hypothetical protein
MTKQLSQMPNPVANSPAAGLNTNTGRVPVRASCMSAAGFGLVRQFGPRRRAQNGAHHSSASVLPWTGYGYLGSVERTLAMARNDIVVGVAPDEMFTLLLDPYAYPKWVVGTRRVREVDRDWPSVGARFHHTVGVGPFSTRDSTRMLTSRPPFD